MNLIHNSSTKMSFRFWVLSALVLSGCARQAPAPAVVVQPQPLTTFSPSQPISTSPSDVVTPTLGISVPLATRQTASGFEIQGTGGAISEPAEQSGDLDSNGGITLNFVNANVTAVAQTIFGQILKQNYTIDGGVQGTITLQTTQPLTQDEVLPALETSLQMANLALTREADGYHIVPIANAPEAGAGNLSVAGGLQTPGYGYEIIPLKYANAASIQKLVQPLAQSNVQIQADSTHNLLIVAGSSQDRAAIAADVAVFDVNWLAGMSYALIPLRNAQAGAVVKEIDQIIDNGDNPGNGLVRLVVIGQLNAILIVTQQPQYLSEIRGLVEKFDQEEESDQQQIFIYQVQNGQASAIAKILSGLFNANGSGADTSSSTSNTTANSAGSAGGAAISSQPIENSTGISGLGGGTPIDQNTASQGNSSGNGGFLSNQATQNTTAQDGDTGQGNDTSDAEPPPRITADDNDNDLLIYATADQYDTIKSALVQIDIAPRQVMIEAVVAEVDLTDQLQYGVQYFFQSGRVQSVNTLGTTSAISKVLPGFSAILSPGNNIQIALTALENLTHVNVLSAPRLLVTNNQAAELQVGDDVPIITQTAESTQAGSAPLVSTVQYQPTGVILNVTPRINAGGLVTLDISQEVSEVSTTTSSTLNSPTITERKISTIVAVPDGQTVALGGLIQSNVTRGTGGIPLLDRIPGLGVLFSNKNNSTTRTELLVMITPHVVESATSLQNVTDALRNEIPDIEPTQ